jgi:hypothetical protein
MKRLKKFEEYNHQQINESLVGDLVKSALNYLLAPITLPAFMNMNTKFKLGAIEKSIEKYLDQKAEYEILDEARYDIEMPSLLLKITKRRNEISKTIKKYPTLEDYKKAYCKWLRKWNAVNFRNKIDINYLCDKIMELGPVNERAYIDKNKSALKFDMNKGKVVDHGLSGWDWRQSRFQNRLNDLRFQQELNQEDNE